MASPSRFRSALSFDPGVLWLAVVLALGCLTVGQARAAVEAAPDAEEGPPAPLGATPGDWARYTAVPSDASDEDTVDVHLIALRARPDGIVDTLVVVSEAYAPPTGVLVAVPPSDTPGQPVAEKGEQEEEEAEGETVQYATALVLPLRPAADRADLAPALERILRDVGRLGATSEDEGVGDYAFRLHTVIRSEAAPDLKIDGLVGETYTGNRQLDVRLVPVTPADKDGLDFQIQGSMVVSTSPEAPFIGLLNARLQLEEIEVEKDDEAKKELLPMGVIIRKSENVETFHVQLDEIGCGGDAPFETLAAWLTPLLPPADAPADSAGFPVFEFSMDKGALTALSFDYASPDWPRLVPALDALPQLGELRLASPLPAPAVLAPLRKKETLQRINGLAAEIFWRRLDNGALARQAAVESAWRKAHAPQWVHLTLTDNEQGQFVGAEVNWGTVRDWSPLLDLPLETLTLGYIQTPSDAKGWDRLRAMASLKRVTVRRKEMDIATFRQQYDAGPLADLFSAAPRFDEAHGHKARLDISTNEKPEIDGAYIQIGENAEFLDLSMLAKWPLEHLALRGAPPADLRGLDALRGLKTLRNIATESKNYSADAFWKAWDSGEALRVWTLIADFARANPNYEILPLVEQDGTITRVSVNATRGRRQQAVPCLTDVTMLEALPLTELGVDARCLVPAGVWAPLLGLKSVQRIDYRDVDWPVDHFRKAFDELARITEIFHRDNPGNACGPLAQLSFHPDAEGRIVRVTVQVHTPEPVRVNLDALRGVLLKELVLKGKIDLASFTAVRADLPALTTVIVDDKTFEPDALMKAIADGTLDALRQAAPNANAEAESATPGTVLVKDAEEPETVEAKAEEAAPKAEEVKEEAKAEIK